MRSAPRAHGHVPASAHLQLFLGMAIFGSTTPLSRIIAQAFPVFSASLLRMVIAVTALAWFARRELPALRTAAPRDWLAIGAITAFGMVGFTATMLFGMRLASGVVGATLMSTTPAVTAAAAVLFLGERFNRRKSAALALAVAGAIAINLSRQNGAGGAAAALGALLVAVAVCFEALYTLLSKAVSDHLSSLAITFAASAAAIPCFALLALAFDAEPLDYAGATPREWLAVLFWGAASGALAPVLWYKGVRRAPGVLSAGYMAVMPVTGLVLSYALLGEAFHGTHLIGFGLAFAGVLLMIREHAVA